MTAGEDMLLAGARNLLRYARVVLLVVSGAATLTPPVCAQTYHIIHTFTQQASYPMDGLVADAAGNLYGSTSAGGNTYNGTIFRMTLRDSAWMYTTIYNFQGGSDGSEPLSTPVFGPDGALYGMTYAGGANPNCPSVCGTVYRLVPPPTVCKTTLCEWSDQVIYSFGSNTPDGYNPYSRVSFDSNGNLYGSTSQGGNLPPPDQNFGAIFQLTHSNGVWSENILLTFIGMGNGNNPTWGVIVDNSGNVYGTSPSADICGTEHYTCGAVFELQQPNWRYSFIYTFDHSDDGTAPYGAPVWDAEGNMYGSTAAGSLDGSSGATIWKLSPSNGSWVRTTLYSWPVGAWGGKGSLTMDAHGNLYGIQAPIYGSGAGSVFKLTNNNGVWSYSTLHEFNGSDGSYPNGSLVVDANGNVFGTTWMGGHPPTGQCYDGCGVVFEITR